MQSGLPLHSARQFLSQLVLVFEPAFVADWLTTVQRPSAIPAQTLCADCSAKSALASPQLAAEPTGQSESLHKHSRSIALPEMR